MPMQRTGWEFLLPCLNKEKRDGARRMDREISDPLVKPCVSSFPTVRITAMCPQGANPFDDCRQAAKNLPDILGYEGL